MDTTPASLILRLRQPDDRAAWERFVRLFAPLLDRWAQKLAGQLADADDLVQDTFAILVRELPKFSYDPEHSFRAWLWRVLRNAWTRRQEKAVPVPAPNDRLEPRLTEDPPSGEAEFREYLVGRAVSLMRSDFSEPTWKACWELVVTGRPAADIGAELGMSVNAVYRAKVRVMTRLRRELAGLID